MPMECTCVSASALTDKCAMNKTVYRMLGDVCGAIQSLNAALQGPSTAEEIDA